MPLQKGFEGATDRGMEKLALDEVDAFLRVVETGSFTAAAQPLGVSKSAVSRRVASLESKLGVRLMERTTRSLRLTEAGRVFHGRVGRAMLDLGDAAESVRQMQDLPQGHLRIAACADVASADLGAMALAFRRQHPGVSLELIWREEAQVAEGEGFDLAIRSGGMSDAAMVARPVPTPKLMLFASPEYLRVHGYPETPADLESHDAVLYRSKSLRERWVMSGARGEQSVDVQGQLSTDDYMYLRELLLAGAGIGALPDGMAISELRSGRLLRVLPEWHREGLALNVVYPRERFNSAKLRVFCEFAVQWLSGRFAPRPELVAVG